MPGILFSVRNKRPEHYGLLPDGDRTDPDSERLLKALNAEIVGQTSPPPPFEFSLFQAMKTKSFWILAESFLAQILVMVGFNTHCIPFLTGMDIDPVVAGGMMGGGDWAPHHLT